MLWSKENSAGIGEEAFERLLVVNELTYKTKSALEHLEVQQLSETTGFNVFVFSILLQPACSGLAITAEEAPNNNACDEQWDMQFWSKPGGHVRLAFV